MNILDDYTREVLRTCIKFNVQFLVVGGYAVNFHGYRRTTGDIDLWLKPCNENKMNVVNALKHLGIDQTVLDQLISMDFTKHLAFNDGEEPFKIDFMTMISGVKFEDAYAAKIISEIDSLSIPFIQLNHLVLSKMNTGRPKDSIDIDQLQKIEQAKKNKK